MSIAEIQFFVKDCYPKNFDFNECEFKIISNDTKFDNFISFQNNNSITDKTELKSDINYSIKALIKGEILGISSFILPKKTFDKKLTNLKFSNINLTLSNAVLNKHFKIPINKKNQLKISISLEIKINYKNKRLKFKKIKQIKNNIVRTNRNEKTPQLKNNNMFLSLTSRSNKSYKSYQNNSFSKFKKEQQSSTNSSLNKIEYQRYYCINSFEKSNSDSDKTVIDSIIIDNDDSFNNDNVIKEKTILTKDNELKDYEIKDKINLILKDLFHIIQEKNNKLNECIINNFKLRNSLNNYNNKIKVVRMKENKLCEIKEKNILKNEILINQRENLNKIINHNLKIRKIENELINKIIENNNYLIFCSLNYEIIKNLLIKAIRNNLDLYIDLNEFFNDEGITIFRRICKKYNLIKDENSQIEEDQNE